MKRRLSSKFVEKCLVNGGGRVDKRREQSKSAARSRRRIEAEVFVDLADVLPISQSERAVYQVDRIAVLRLAVTYYRLRELVNTAFRPLHTVSTYDLDLGAETSLDYNLDGFLIIVSQSGHMLYVSDAVSQYIGFTQADLMGRSFKDYVYTEESEEVNEELKLLAGNKEKLFFRMKTALTPRGGRSRKLTTAVCQAMRATVTRVGSTSKNNEAVFYLHCVPVSNNHSRSFGFANVLMSRHEVDMKFRFCEERLSSLLQYKNSKGLNGHSLYQFVHPEDLQHVAYSFKLLYSKGHCTTDYYKLLRKSGHYVWVMTDASLMTQNVRGVHQKYVICSHQILSNPVKDFEIGLNGIKVFSDESHHHMRPVKRSRLEKPDNLPKFSNIEIKRETDNYNSGCCSNNSCLPSTSKATTTTHFSSIGSQQRFYTNENCCKKMTTDVKPSLKELRFDFDSIEVPNANWTSSIFSLKSDFDYDDLSYLAPYVADDLLDLVKCEDMPGYFKSNFDCAGALMVTKRDDLLSYRNAKLSSATRNSSNSSTETSDPLIPVYDDVFYHHSERDASNDEWKIAMIKNDLVESAGKFLEMSPQF